ncbi:Cytochrome c family protein [hydrothermal vent metagenome]|uniref:Cytochrome c family protein n=1 Tax=hydrothermal vent metagenome TaxID=652676 RepID=A0A1W1CLC6_9ZZZZ
MKKRFYSPLLLTPLIFIACNTTQPTKKAQKITETPVVEVAEKELTKQVPTTTTQKVATTTIGGVKYVKKDIVQEQGLFHIKSFMGTLKPTLKSAMKDGVATGFGVCSAISTEMTNDYNALTTDTKVRRTALKYRNPKNKPDTTDRAVMNELVRKGDFKPVTIDAGDHYRVYKPLPTKGECLVCHGDSSKIPSKVSEMIKRKYPKDLAIDFAEGEFRGAIVAEIKK